MEQRINSKTKSEFAAGTDPAYIPGLTAPAPVVTEKEEDPEEAGALAKSAETGSEDAAAGETAPGDGTATEDGTDADAALEPEEARIPEEEGGDGPVFEVSDRRGSIRVAREGVRFRLDDQEAEFGWDEMGAVEIKPARFGRRFTVTVHLTTRRWFNAEVEAPARGDLKKWTAQLDEVLDAYFEES